MTSANTGYSANGRTSSTDTSRRPRTTSRNVSRQWSRDDIDNAILRILEVDGHCILWCILQHAQYHGEVLTITFYWAVASHMHAVKCCLEIGC
jgi:hypothetical protein